MNLKICYGKTTIQLQIYLTRGMSQKRDKIPRLDNLKTLKDKDIENSDIRKYAKNVLMMIVLLKKIKNSDIESAIEC